VGERTAASEIAVTAVRGWKKNRPLSIDGRSIGSRVHCVMRGGEEKGRKETPSPLWKKKSPRGPGPGHGKPVGLSDRGERRGAAKNQRLCRSSRVGMGFVRGESRTEKKEGFLMARGKRETDLVGEHISLGHRAPVHRLRKESGEIKKGNTALLPPLLPSELEHFSRSLTGKRKS